jgi:putative Mn2+ efflux pump MntP
MGLVVILGIAVGLALDAFAVAVAGSVSLGRVTGRQVFRFAFHFGLFQAGMPLIGWLAGRGVQQYMAAWDHWVAFGLLAFIGGKAIVTALRSGESTKPRGDPTRGWTLLMLSVATSIDALAVGLSLGMLEVAIWYPALIIGVVTAGLTALGMLIGSRLGARFGRWTEIAGGLVLIGIGVKILVEHIA